MEKISINVEDLARYIFEINTNNKIFLDINSIKTNKELFFFYFDLFCKGLIITFSHAICQSVILDREKAWSTPTGSCLRREAFQGIVKTLELL